MNSNRDATFKARVAREALKGIKTIQQIAKEYEVDPVQVLEWKTTASEHLPDLFDRRLAGEEGEDFKRERGGLIKRISDPAFIVGMASLVLMIILLVMANLSEVVMSKASIRFDQSPVFPIFKYCGLFLNVVFVLSFLILWIESFVIFFATQYSRSPFQNIALFLVIVMGTVIAAFAMHIWYHLRFVPKNHPTAV